MFYEHAHDASSGLQTEVTQLHMLNSVATLGKTLGSREGHQPGSTSSLHLLHWCPLLGIKVVEHHGLT